MTGRDAFESAVHHGLNDGEELAMGLSALVRKNDDMAPTIFGIGVTTN